MARSLKSIMSSIVEMSDETYSPDLFAVLYSEFGVGKTVAVAYLAQLIKGEGDILFCDSSDGWAALQEFSGLTEDVDLFPAKDPSDLIVVANGISSGKLKSRQGNPYTVVILDEGSSMYDVMLEQHVREKYGLSEDDPYPEIEGKEYGPATMAFESLLRKFHDIDGLHVIVTTHAREVGESKATRELRPSLPPGAYKALMRKAQICAALSASRRRDPQTKELEYVRSVQLKPSANVSAKSRMPGSPVKMGLEEFVEAVADWVASDNFVTDISGQAEAQELAEDVDEAEQDDIEQDDEEFDADEVAEEALDEGEEENE